VEIFFFSAYAPDLAVTLNNLCKLESHVLTLPLDKNVHLVEPNVILCIKRADIQYIQKYYSNYETNVYLLDIPNLIEKPLSNIMQRYLELEIEKSLRFLSYTHENTP